MNSQSFKEQQLQKVKLIEDVFKFIKEKEAKFIDLRFIDMVGQWQHFSIPINQLSKDTFFEGLGFDGSSIKGWKSINDSDMIAIPDPSTAKIDPFMEPKSVIMICDIYDPITNLPYSLDPRYIARKAADYLISSGVADKAYFGPEAEFFIFDHVAYNINEYSSWYEIDSREGFWNTGSDKEVNLGHKIRSKEGYFPVPPADSLNDLRNLMVNNLGSVGIEVERQHHEVATAGQAEIDFKYADLLDCADKLMLFKYIIKNTALKAGKTATFMPKPIYDDNGSGMHIHTSFWKDGVNLFAGDKYGGLSQTALYYIGGILKHAPSLLAFTNATTNSYKRLVPGYEAPVNLVYSKSNRSASIRIPMYSDNPKSKRVEFRSPDGTANPYLAFSAIAMAGIDGILNKIDPGEAMDRNVYELSEAERKSIRQAPETFEQALHALEKDNDYLKAGDVFTDELIQHWIDFKFKKEITEVALRPHPYEFHLYYEM